MNDELFPLTALLQRRLYTTMTNRKRQRPRNEKRTIFPFFFFLSRIKCSKLYTMHINICTCSFPRKVISKPLKLLHSIILCVRSMWRDDVL